MRSKECKFECPFINSRVNDGVCPMATMPKSAEEEALDGCADLAAVTTSRRVRGLDLWQLDLISDTESMGFDRGYGFGTFGRRNTYSRRLADLDKD